MLGSGLQDQNWGTLSYRNDANDFMENALVTVMTFPPGREVPSCVVDLQ